MMVTTDDLTALRDIAIQAYWACETAHDLVCDNDDNWLLDKIPTLVDKLKRYQQALGDACQPALNTIEQAAAVENLPVFVIGDKECQTATGEAILLVTRLYFRISTGNPAEIREAVAAMPTVDYNRAQKRVRAEWNAAVRLLNGASLPASMAALAEDDRDAGPTRTTEPNGTQENTQSSDRKNTGRGDADIKIISALCEHHKYKNGSCLCLEPMGSNELSRKAVVAQGSMTAFWKRRYRKHGNDGSYESYRRSCGNDTLPALLALWSGETSAVEMIQLLADDRRQNRDDD